MALIDRMRFLLTDVYGAGRRLDRFRYQIFQGAEPDFHMSSWTCRSMSVSMLWQYSV